MFSSRLLQICFMWERVNVLSVDENDPEIMLLDVLPDKQLSHPSDPSHYIQLQSFLPYYQSVADN